ncbi:nicotinate-nucleotide adenylyltransferase [Salibacterium qingdaonense]|uniref:Probable nicotinate-nucleotide adenylyltransferase n=1 Tax=Salibacterium qingdaonense TaxID=266892 RepID=A0A1I4JGC1_9BACI|nr:nicotinate-nucleotide adenylyltransferase [Salibacterium qingdaonense]SFL65620.1 nicotinate-nucleotide adenylyltransferase [Salibacterium qingdaonense]
MKKKIGLLGGTFDPPHHAHLIIAQEALTILELDEVWFIPVYSPPHKSRDYMAGPDERLQMTKLAAEGNRHFFTSTVELDRKGPSYTLDTVKRLNEEYPDTDFYFIVGGDMAAGLSSWKNIEELMKRVTFAVIDRPGYSSPKSGDSMCYIEVPLMDISSTMIRERIQQGRNIRYYLPEPVRTYIKENKLYE